MADPERELLERARRGLEPTAADVARVRRGVSAALAGVALAPAPDVPEAPLGAGAGMSSSPWIAKLVIAGAVAAAGAIGYAAGHRAGVSEGRGRAPVSAPAVTVPNATAVDLSPVPPAPAPAQPTAETARRAPAPSGSLRPSAPPGAVASNHAAFDEEVIQLRRVQRALREGNARLALALLDDLERAVPHGRLSEERAAANALARCALGVGPPAVLASDFATRYPSSVYGARVAQACGVRDAGE
jgi:hypothetical protein